MIVSYMNAIRDGIAEEMRRDPTVIAIGEGIGERGGSYGHTKELWREFGPERVIDTPICELGFTGMAVGAAATGLRPIVDLMFADMLLEAMSPLCQQAGKLCYMSNGKVQVPLVVRAQMGGKTTGAHHSGCLYPLFMHMPGLKVVAPSTASDAKGLMKAAIRDPDPVVFFEHKFLYSKKEEVPECEHLVPLGRARVMREGSEVTVVAIGAMVHRALEVAASGVVSADLEIIDPRTLYPLDTGTIVASVQKTGRLVVVEEAQITCGAGAEIAAQVAGQAFRYLRAPVERLGSLDIPNPYSPALEKAMMPNEEDVVAAVTRAMSWTPEPASADALVDGGCLS